MQRLLIAHGECIRGTATLVEQDEAVASLKPRAEYPSDVPRRLLPHEDVAVS